MKKVEIGLTSKDVDNLADFVCHHCFTQIETEGKIKLSIGMIKRAIVLDSFIYQKKLLNADECKSIITFFNDNQKLHFPGIMVLENLKQKYPRTFLPISRFK